MPRQAGPSLPQWEEPVHSRTNRCGGLRYSESDIVVVFTLALTLTLTSASDPNLQSKLARYDTANLDRSSQDDRSSRLPILNG